AFSQAPRLRPGAGLSLRRAGAGGAVRRAPRARAAQGQARMKRFAFIMLLMPLALGAQELRVLSGGAAKSLVDPLARSFRQAKVEVRYQPMGPLADSLAQGAEVDLVIVHGAPRPRVDVTA